MDRKFKTGYRIVAIFLIAMAITHGVELWQQRGRILAGYGDFSAFYTAGSLIRQGEGKFLYDLREQWAFQQTFASRVDIRKGAIPFIRPPFEALIFLPLAYFSYPAALTIWSLAKLILLWLSVRILPRAEPFTRIYPLWLEVVLCLGLFPVFLDLLQGQDAILLLLIVAAVFNRLHSGKYVMAGMILALGLFKFHLVVPIAIMIWLSGRARILAGFLPVAAALMGLSCLISGVGVLAAYPEYLFNLTRATGVGVLTARNMPNLRGLFTAFLAPHLQLILWLLLATAVAGIILTGRLWRPLMNAGFAGLGLGYCLALLTAILTGYYANSYDMTLLVIPLLLLSGGFLEDRTSGHATLDRPPSDGRALSGRPRRMLVAGLLLLICTPLYWALIQRLDSPYLLVVPMFVLALGIAGVMRRSRPASA